MPIPFAAIGAGLGAIQGIGKFLFGVKQNQLANQINPVYTPYQENPYAKQQLDIARQFLGGRMGGATTFEKNIQNSQANAMQNVLRNATDSSQALALGSAIQGQTDQAYADLQAREAQNKYGLLQNLNQAYGLNIAEGDKKYNDMLKKFQIDLAAKSGLRSSAANNMFGAFSDLAALGIGAGSYLNTGK